MANNGNLTIAKAVKNDEFYTRREDIEEEMNAYLEWNADIFRNKAVLLPCDDPDWSGFTQYFTKNFDRLGLKKLVSTCYAKGRGGTTATELEKTLPLFNPNGGPKGKLLVMERTSDGDAKIEFRHLKGDGDFRSPEVRKLRDDADFIVTNPPFSLFREFMAWVHESKNQFIVLGNTNAITYKEIFPKLKENKTWLGATHPKTFSAFATEDVHSNVSADKDGRRWASFGNICWFTNVDHFRHHQELVFGTMQENLIGNAKLRKKLEADYGVAKYPKYDNYDAIEVPFVDAIPKDYAGVMGVPVTFLDKHNPEQFEIIGLAAGNIRGLAGIPTSTGKDGPYINGKLKYGRILIRNLHPEPCAVPLAEVVQEHAAPASNPAPSVPSAPDPSRLKEVSLETLMAHAGMPSAPETAPKLDDDEGFSPCP